jgi:diguanylate cyclase (GGDEF)-like protein/PAS domain S-box-containing protein
MAAMSANVIDAASLIDALRDALLVIDGATTLLLDVNAAACTLSEYTRAELLNMPAAALCPPEQRAALQQAFQEALTRETLGAVYRLDLQTRSGRLVPMEFSNQLVATQRGPVIVACGRDISERLALEGSAREAAERFTLILNNAPLSIQLKDLTGRFTLVNDSYTRLVERTREELIGCTVDDLYGPDVARQFTSYDRLVAETGESSTLESSLDMRDGKRHFLTVKFPLRSSEGEISGVGTIVSDVTQLRHAQEQLDQFFTLSNDIFVVFGPDGVFERFNPALERVLGYSAEELLATQAIDLVHPDDLGALAASRAAFARADHAHHVEVRYRHKSGHYVWLDWTGSPRTAEGRSFFAARDVSERRRMQAESEMHALQQAALSNLSRLVLDELAIDDLLAEATQLVSEALATEVGAALEATGDDAFAVRAMFGAEAELIGTRIDHSSLAGYAYSRGATVMAGDLASEQRFTPSDLQRRLGARSGMAAPLRLREHQYGVIEVLTRQQRSFTLEEATFLASVASVLATAIDRSRAAHALRESEERYRRIFEDAIEGVFQADLAGRFIVANDAVARMLGYRSGEELIAEVTDIRTQIAVDRTRVDELMLLLRTTGVARAFNLQVKRRDGSLADVRLNARASASPSGEFAVSALVVDVTVEYAAARALRESEERYRRIFEDSAEGIYQTNGRAGFAFMNAACARMLGYDSPEEAIAAVRDIGQVYADPASRAQLAVALNEHGSVQGKEFGLRRADGGIATISLNARLVDDGHGVQVVAGVCSDITAEREARLALEQSEEQYRRIVESTSEGIWTIDADNVTTFVNGRLAGMLGYTREEMLGRPLRDFIRPEAWATAQAALKRRAQGVAEEFAQELVRKNGSIVQAEISSTPLFERGAYIGSLALVRDVSELREAQQYKHRAFHDPLTGLPNRELFGEYLEQGLRAATRRGAPATVLMIDLDGFKAVNDTFGHQTGDAVLQAVALRLRAALRESDSVARLSGDEFAVLLPDTDATQARLVAEKLVELVSQPVEIGRQRPAVGLSVGVASFPAHGHSGALLLRRADSAMYVAKRGKLGCTVWSVALDRGRSRAS